MIPLTGRSAQLSWIEEQLAAGGSVVVAGEAGVGKTRLMTEVVDRAAAEGRPVARIVASSSGLALPLAPLAHLLPPGIDPEGGLGALHQALEAFRALGAGQRLLVGVDDAQHLDDLSALVVQQAIAGEAIQVVATVRTSGEVIPDVVEQFWRGPGGARLDLQRLDPSAVAALVEAALDGPADAGTLALLEHTSDGSPLMLLALLAHGRATGRLAEADGLWHWTGELGANPRLQELIGFSVDRLTPAEREVVEVVALVEPLAVDLVERLAPAGMAADLERRGVLAPAAEPGYVRPGHPLIGETVLAALTPLNRRRLLGSVFDVFTADAGDRVLPPNDEMRVALWSLDGDRSLPVERLRSAARLARSHHAGTEAERLARAAYALEPDAGMGVLIGRTLHGQLRFDEAEAAYAEVEPLARTDDEIVDLAVNRALTLRFGLGRLDDAAAVLDDARRRVSDPSLAWELAATEARDAVMSGQALGVAALWAEADDAPENARFRLAESAAAALGSMGRLRECGDVVAWVASVAPAHVEIAPMVLPLAQHWLAGSLATAGEVAISRAMVEPLYDQAVQGGQVLQQAYLAAPFAVVMAHVGDVRAAERLGREAGLVPESSKSVRFVGLAVAARALVSQDRLDDAAEVLAVLDVERDPLLRAADLPEQIAAAALAHARGNERDALDRLEAAFRSSQAAGTRVMGMHVAFELIRLDGPRGVIDDAIRSAAEIEGAFAELVAAYGRAARDGDVVALNEVAIAAVEADLRPVAVAALTTAMELEHDAGRTAAMARLDERRTDILADCPGLVVRDRAVDLGLSDREREIATLAAAGVPDKRIAADLGISVRTVNAHLRSVYAKLGISSRLDLADVPGLAATTGRPGQ